MEINKIPYVQVRGHGVSGSAGEWLAAVIVCIILGTLLGCAFLDINVLDILIKAL